MDVSWVHLAQHKPELGIQAQALTESGGQENQLAQSDLANVASASQQVHEQRQLPQFHASMAAG